MAKKCTKKCDARVKFLFCQSKPIAFLPFSLRLPLSFHSLLFLPTVLLFLGSCPPSSRLEGLGVDGFSSFLKFFYVLVFKLLALQTPTLYFSGLAPIPFPFSSHLCSSAHRTFIAQVPTLPPQFPVFSFFSQVEN